MPNYTINFFFRLIFIISLSAIISAYYIQYILGHQPCNLCIIERVPYILSLIILIIKYKFKINQKFFVLSLIVIFFFSFMVSIYHFGIEQGFFQESSFCNVKDVTNTLSKEELLKQLQEKVVSCKDVTFRFLGISLTAINNF